MKYLLATTALLLLTACQSNSPATQTADACGASNYQNLIGKPSRDALGLAIPSNSRHYGSEEKVATDTPTRLNFVHSGTAVESVTNPDSKIIRVFCG